MTACTTLPRPAEPTGSGAQASASGIRVMAVLATLMAFGSISTDLYPDRSGAASALVGGLQYGSGIVGSALVGVLADGTPWTLGLVVALAGYGSLACARLLPPADRFSAP